ncbi:MAG: polysaccharide biosynthesis protein, partial [Pseudomonadota bacterium]
MSEKQHTVWRRTLAHPRAAVVVHDLCMVFLAWAAARFIAERLFDVSILDTWPLAGEWPLVMLLQGVVLWATGLYKGLWRFASFNDMWNIARAAVFGGLMILIALAILRGGQFAAWLPEVIVYPPLLFVTLAFPRMFYRFWKDSRLTYQDEDGSLKRALILGAGRSGAMLERELRHRGGYRLIGFLDDNERLRGSEVHGVPVLGTIDELPTLGQQLRIDLAVIAVPSANNQQMQRIVRICEESEIEFRTLPTLQDMGNKATRINVLKKVAIDDLLGREPVSLDWDAMRSGLVGKRVMVTGGGGSIGAELCRQIARLNPVELVVVDNGEFALYR